MMHRKLLSILFLLVTLSLSAQTAKDEAKLAERLNTYFAKYKPKGTRLTQAPRMVGYQLDHQAKTLVITADEFFACQEFTPEITEHIYKKIKGEMPKPFKDYQVTVVTNGMTIDELIPNRLSATCRYGPVTDASTTKAEATGAGSVRSCLVPLKTNTHRPSSFPT